jgi:hypothetical protein
VNKTLSDLAAKAGVSFFDYQVQALHAAAAQTGQQRMCLYYKTGAGKSLTSLACMGVWGEREVLVLAPPSTHPEWKELGRRLGISVDAISHARFRQSEYKLSRSKAVIVDEFHLLGGHTGKGWKKMDRLARGLTAPLLLMSATPNYNDADRVYCIQHVLDPHSVKGGFLEFLYTHCTTEQNPFSQTPNVTGFQKYADAAEYLAALPYVEYLPDDLQYTIDDVVIPRQPTPDLDEFGFNYRDDRIVASGIEEKHVRVNLGLVADDGRVWGSHYTILMAMVAKSRTPVLVYSNHSTVADALAQSLRDNQVKHGLVTGSTPAKKKAAILDAFRDGVLDVLVGTATLATGTDGLDKVCDMLIILDDTDDASLRRQLIGRIMPRGADADATKKQVFRLVLA